VSHSRPNAGFERSVGAFGRRRRVGLLDFFLGLVTGAGTAGRADRTTDDGAGGSGDRATDEGTGSSATKGPRARTGLVVAFGRLTGDRAADRADRAADHCARRSTDRHSDGRAAKGAGPGAHGLGAAFLVLRGGAGPATLVQEVVIVGMIVRDRRVVVHKGPPLDPDDRQMPVT